MSKLPSWQLDFKPNTDTVRINTDSLETETQTEEQETEGTAKEQVDHTIDLGMDKQALEKVSNYIECLQNNEMYDEKQGKVGQDHQTVQKHNETEAIFSVEHEGKTSNQPSSLSFADIIQMVQSGKEPDDIRKDIDDSPVGGQLKSRGSKSVQKKPWER
eukprot:TRINITY_DN10443_c0_g1_i1.p1 TRINITY_DN10443_c0_g1~~TRINITY_DN10443_c0_g1_i1.p1  ORF type:complete len:159 (+),score=37.23 TRINITY_DN10443_c0_g1_i1:106-582(+)